MDILHRVQQHLRRRALLPEGARVVVGVSGGLDSVTLLHMLHRLAPRWGWALHVATLDHGLRAAVGADDAAFVAQLCVAWGLPVTAGSIDGLELQQALGQSAETTARRARYDFLAQVAQQQGAQIVVVAHHRDDQAETVLLHLLRGSGTRGLGGMAWRAPLPGHPHLTLVRPLLAEDRAALEAYAHAHALAWRHDATNDSLAPRRNRVRHVVMPVLRTMNPQAGAVLAQAAHLLADDDAYLHSVASRVASALAQDHAGGLQVMRAGFAGLPLALQRRALRLWAQQVNPQSEPSFATVEAALDTALHAPVGTIAELPGRVLVRVSTPDALVVAHADAPQPTGILLPPSTTIDLPVPGRADAPGGWAVVVSVVAEGVLGQHVGLTDDTVRLVLRTRQPGDRFAPPALSGHTQKLGAWMTAQRIPVGSREMVPLVAEHATQRVLAVCHGQRWHTAWFEAANVGLCVDLRLENVVGRSASVDTRLS